MHCSSPSLSHTLPSRHDLVHLCTGETNSRAAPSAFVLNKHVVGVFKGKDHIKINDNEPSSKTKYNKRHDGQFDERIAQIYNSMCNHRCFIPRAAQRNVESGAVWNTSSPAHKGDVNVIRAHWSGKSSTGSWRLDGEVSPGLWGGWGRGRGRSQWSQATLRVMEQTQVRCSRSAVWWAEYNWMTWSLLNYRPEWISKGSPAPPVCPRCTRCPC